MSADDLRPKRQALVDAILAGLRELLMEAPAAAAPPADAGRLLKVKDVAVRYGVDASVVYKWVKSGVLPRLRLPGGDYRFREADLAEFDLRRATGWTPPQPEPAPAPAPGQTETLVIKEHPGGGTSVVRKEEVEKLSPESQKQLRTALHREAARRQGPRPTLANGGPA